ncbi:MAG: TIGR04211 family SH3 domain-containing protein, partial [Gammaproteobacteria bacterium]|nr:TIGR04211 family SH3 domain-containing protein [Gammaproteobacteria bacterium]
MQKFVLAACVSLSLLSASIVEAAEERWVTDRGEFTMRSGKSTSNKIIRMLKSGVRVELLKTDSISGYSLVRMSNGQEGWVLSRYLVKSPPALLRLPQLEKDLSRVSQLSDERQALQSEVRVLTSDNKKLSLELERIKKVSANAVKLDSENTKLRESLGSSRSRISELEE